MTVQAKQRRMGADMSARQIAWTVKNGSRVTFFADSLPERSIEGYVCGMDDYHWMVVTPQGTKHLIHKASTHATIHDDPTFQEEPHYGDLERVVGPFRRHVLSEFFGQATPEHTD